MKTEISLQTSKIVSDIDDDLALGDEEYHDALLGYREARDLMKETRVARGFCLVVVPFVPTSPLAKEKVLPQVTGILARLVVTEVEEDRKFLDDLPTLVDAARKGKVEDVQELMMVHQTLKSVSSVVRVIIGRVTVQRWMMALRVRRNEILELTDMVRGLATILTILVKRVHQTYFRWIPCAVLRCLLFKVMSVKLMLHFWWNLKVSVFWTVVQPLLLEALRL